MGAEGAGSVQPQQPQTQHSQAPATQQTQPQPQQPQPSGIQPRGVAPRSGIQPRGVAPGQHGNQQRQQPQPVAGKTGDWLQTGEAATAYANQARVRQQAERERNALKPFRFYLDWKRREQADLIILDTVLGPRLYEHDIRNPRTGFNDINEQCVAELGEICPCCPPAGERPAVYRMFLSVIDLRPYVGQDGRQVAATKKLLPVGLDQQGIYERWLERYGNLRGVQALHIRDGGQRSSRIGNQIEFVQQHGEQDLVAFAQENGLWQERITQRGTKVWGEGEFILPYDYTLVFPRPDVNRLREMYGQTGGAPMGSTQYNQQGGQQGGGWGGNAPGQRPQRGGFTQSHGYDQSQGGNQQGGDFQQGGGLDDDAVPF